MSDSRLPDPNSGFTFPDFVFKVAAEPWEFQQVHRLNYVTFVEEVPQHPANDREVLVDDFHDENTYFVCLRRRHLAGMVAVRSKRPFSLDLKLGDFERFLPGVTSPCEIRLLAIEKQHRGGLVLRGLLTALARHCVQEGFDVALISGSVAQERLYRRLGFRPFGPTVGSPDAMFQPMYRPLQGVHDEFGAHLARSPGRVQTGPP